MYSTTTTLLTLCIALTILSVFPTLVKSNAGFRYAHCSPDAPKLNVYLNGTLKFQNVSYETITSYTYVTAGIYNLIVRDVPTNTVRINRTYTFADQHPYTVAGLNTLAKIGPDLYDDFNSYPIPLGDTDIRFVQTSADTPNVDFKLTDLLQTFTLTNISFGEATTFSQTGFGLYEFDVYLTGTTTSLFSSSLNLLLPNTAYGYYLMGSYLSSTLVMVQSVEV